MLTLARNLQKRNVKNKILEFFLEILPKNVFQAKVEKNIWNSAQLWHLASLDKDKAFSGIV